MSAYFILRIRKAQIESFMSESVAVNMMVKKHSSRIGQFPQSDRQKQPNITKMNKKP